MTLSRSKAMMICATLFSGTITGCGALDTITPASQANTRIRIASEPSGADVYIMGKHAGATPITISERDIYPVSYDARVEKLYGMVFLRKDGCEEYSRRLTRSDINNGLTARLECGGDTPASPPQPAVSQPEAPAADAPKYAPLQQPKTQTNQTDLTETRLRQLKTLQQLNDEGLISDEEERKLRRRILDKL